MLFNFVIVGSTAERLAALDDTLRPLFFGLRALGHRVMSVGRSFEPRPAVNIVLADDGFGGGLASRVRGEAGKGTCIGLLCPDEPAAEDLRLAKTTDFVWTCSLAAAMADRQAVVSFGFDPAMLGARLERDPARRDGGVIVYGEEGERSTMAEQALAKAGVPALFARASHFPDYIVSDLLGRAALAVVVRRKAQDRAPPPMRIAKALCNGALVVAEAGVAGDLAPYATECAFDEIPGRCLSLLKEGAVPRGLDALERYRRETSMAKGLEAAVRVAEAAAGVS